MKQIGFKYFLDTSVWVNYFYLKEKNIGDIVDGDNLLHTSSLTLFEIKRKLLRDNEKKERIHSILEFIKKSSIVLILNQELCEEAAEVSHKYNLPAVDSLIYTSSLKNQCILVTTDNHFNSLDNVKIL